MDNDQRPNGDIVADCGNPVGRISRAPPQGRGQAELGFPNATAFYSAHREEMDAGGANRYRPRRTATQRQK